MYIGFQTLLYNCTLCAGAHYSCTLQSSRKVGAGTIDSYKGRQIVFPYNQVLCHYYTRILQQANFTIYPWCVTFMCNMYCGTINQIKNLRVATDLRPRLTLQKTQKHIIGSPNNLFAMSDLSEQPLRNQIVISIFISSVGIIKQVP